MSVILETSLGDITIDLLTAERPKCCRNFLKLCKIKYYNFILFHSIQRNLVAQTGDPTGTGHGGESVYGILYGDQAKYFDMEVNPRIKHKKMGTVSMVNNGTNMHGSQFFITLGENLDYLDQSHTVFGEVAEGIEVLNKINEAYCDKEHRPFKDIRIYHTVIIDDPFDDPDGLEVPDRSPEPTKQQLDSGRIGADEDIDEFMGMTEKEVQVIMEEREAKANAQILTMVGDLPEEDVAPPENVLFVCKLNPVTSDEDLEMIFSRFGPIKSCEVIRDYKTGESLQYAFIEFTKEQDCENAFFKMDNVLIDDRRIHVDFSQSVSKIKWKGKGKGVIYAKDTDDGNKEKFSSNFRIKDNTRKDSKYDLVFDDGDEDNNVDKEKKKKKKKHKHRNNHSEDEMKPTKHKKHKHKKLQSPEKKMVRSVSPQSPAQSKLSTRDRLRSHEKSRHIKSVNKQKPRSRERSKSQERYSSKRRQNSLDKSRSKERSESPMVERRKKPRSDDRIQSRSKEIPNSPTEQRRRKHRSEERSGSLEGSRSPSEHCRKRQKPFDRAQSPEKAGSPSVRDRKKPKLVDRSRSKSQERSRSPSIRGRKKQRSVKRSLSKSRERSRSPNLKVRKEQISVDRSRSRSQKRSRSPAVRGRKKQQSVDRSWSKERSRSPSVQGRKKQRSADRSRSRERHSKDTYQDRDSRYSDYKSEKSKKKDR